MKHILTFSTVALVTLMYLTGCETDPNSGLDAPDIRPMASSQADAQPAIAYITSTTIKGKTYEAIGVMDTNGSNQAIIYTAPSQQGLFNITKLSWSPGGGSIVFQISDANNSIYPSIYLRDISVSRGKAVGSNTRSIFSLSDYAHTLYGVSWSPVASDAKIAFITREGSTNKVQTVSTSGGTPTVLYQSSTKKYNSPTWSPDGSKIAFVDKKNTSSPYEDTIRVINASSGALLESIAIGTTYNSYGIEWSRSGANLIALTPDYTSTPDDWVLYYVTPTTGSTPWTNGYRGPYFSWSPNNSSLITGPTLVKVDYGTTTASTITSGNTFFGPNWKR